MKEQKTSIIQQKLMQGGNKWNQLKNTKQFGYSLRGIQATNILYDSTTTKGGEGLYPKINEKGATGYYILDGIASLTAGYLFVINGYLPMIICLAFTIIATIISTRFKDIYINKLEENEISNKVKEYKEDFKLSLKNIITSKRVRALLIFMGIFNALITITGTYKGNILTELNVKPETFFNDKCNIYSHSRCCDNVSGQNT